MSVEAPVFPVRGPEGEATLARPALTHFETSRLEPPPLPAPPPPPKGASGQQLVWGGVVGLHNRGVAPPPPGGTGIPGRAAACVGRRVVCRCACRWGHLVCSVGGAKVLHRVPPPPPPPLLSQEHRPRSDQHWGGGVVPVAVHHEAAPPLPPLPAAQCRPMPGGLACAPCTVWRCRGTAKR